jgi:anti-sigma factor RsiW
MRERLLDGHPDDALLDRLRAGLLDGAPETRRALDAHLESCAACRQRYQRWPQAARSAFDADAHDPALTRALAARRRAALQGARPAARTRFAPYALALAASLAALAAAIGAALYLAPSSAPMQTAEISAPEPDLYADIDFYLWLAIHETERSPSPDPS